MKININAKEMATATVKCPECSVPVKLENLKKHIRRTHSTEAIEKRDKKENELVICKLCGLKLKPRNLSRHTKRVHDIRDPLRLLSRRGKRMDQTQKCKVCDKTKAPVWRYSKSTRGEVYICVSCKPMLLDFSFGRKDALDYAKLGGGFETNRRKY
ncbi:hypothetical protein ACFL17_10605 [Pseudomonadota bacterium]